MGAGVIRVAMGVGVWWAHRAVVFNGLVGGWYVDPLVYEAVGGG